MEALGAADVEALASGPPLPDAIGTAPWPLKIAIVGAGIGGLATALGLRRNGHEVHVYEQSRFANEVGAAVHLAPNANGTLRRWGILAENIGANPMDRLVEYMKDGQLRNNIDLTGPNKRWQHPWLLVHRVNLHDQLKKLAISETGVGTPVKLHTASKVAGVDPEQGSLTLQNGAVITADFVVGADGIYSMTRKHIKNAKLFSSGKAAFRFLIPRRVGEEDPVTAPLVEPKNALSMWYGGDRRIVMYPCNDNQLLNFVCIHPDTESHATRSDEWNKQGSLEQVLKVYQDFDSAVKTLISKVEASTLRVWQLLDMEVLPTWTTGKLVLLGDAAHPFTPHQGQGAAQAIEDAAALTVVFPAGTTTTDIPERLKLFEKIRYERAHVVQEYSRLAGKDWQNGRPSVDMMAYTNYNFGHDETDHATNVFKRHQWSKSPFPSGVPTPFGPFPSLRHGLARSSGISHPRQKQLLSVLFPDYDNGGHQRQHKTRTTTATVEFKTSRTFLETLFPTAELRFQKADTVATASLVVTRRVALGEGKGEAKAQLGLHIHGVQYSEGDSAIAEGTYVPVVFVSGGEGEEEGVSAGPVVAGCDVVMEYGKSDSKSCRVVVGWRGVPFLELVIPALETARDEAIRDETSILVYQLVPAEGPGAGESAGGEYACVARPLPQTADVEVSVPSDVKGVEVRASAWDPERLPTLHHVTAVLAEIPIYEVLNAVVVEHQA